MSHCRILHFILFFFLLIFLPFTGGGLPGHLRRQAVRPCRFVREENGLLQPQQSQGHGHSAARQVRGERPSVANRAETTGRRAEHLFLFGKYSNERGHMTEGATGRLWPGSLFVPAACWRCLSDDWARRGNRDSRASVCVGGSSGPPGH